MNNQFSIGEIAILVRTGEELKILGLPKMQQGLSRDGEYIKSTSPCYTTRAQDGFIGWAHESYLRKKPKFEAGSWDAQVFQDLGWNPSKLGVE